MQIEFDSAKQAKTLAERGIDFRDAEQVFAGPLLTQADSRFDYGEERCITFGMLGADWVMVVWTPRGAARRIISMRYANEREIASFAHRVG